MAHDNSELYGMLATALDEVGLSDTAPDSLVLAKDRRRFVEMLEAAYHRASSFVSQHSWLLWSEVILGANKLKAT